MALSIQKLILITAAVYGTSATAQESIELLEPGIGYSRLKKFEEMGDRFKFGVRKLYQGYHLYS
jgi:hypothetical protein